MELTPRRKKVLTYVLAFISIGFLLLTAFVLYFPESVIDREFSEDVQSYQLPLFDKLMKMVSYPGYMPEAPIMVITCAGIFYLKKFKKEALFVVLTMLSGLVSTIVKYLVDRPRPSSDIVKIALQTHQQSFPSGHVMFYVIFFGFVALLMYSLKTINRALRITIGVLCMAMIFTIPVSRIYLGAHWFTDVLGGFLLGIICLYALGYFYLRDQQQG
ncbi:MAG: phosphatase PAP2 family protein [Sphingobacteriaceae bacterium]|nr:MAG: phosphatase PAP2 family protein [Sphingobacteriaceae bacterium]